jgi:selenocysteine lyase/cysteine desulfurase
MAQHRLTIDVSADKVPVEVKERLNALFGHDGAPGRGADEPLGHAAKKWFGFRDDVANINHGSFGATPLWVLKKQFELLLHVESAPEEWFRHNAFPLLRTVRARVGALIHADPEDLFFVQNAGEAFNTVAASLFKGKRVLATTLAYPMVRNKLQHMVDTGDATVVYTPITHAMLQDYDAYVAHIAHTVVAEGPFDAFVMDGVCFAPAVVMPVAATARAIKAVAQECLVVVDGAHGVGLVPVDLGKEAFPADVYFSNYHKWFMTPRQCALLWLRRGLHDKVHPLVVSNMYKRGLEREFFWVGTKDHSHCASVGFAMDFREGLGGEDRIMKYCSDVAFGAMHAVAKVWGTEPFTTDRSKLCGLFSVRSPVPHADPRIGEYIHAATVLMFRRHNSLIHLYPFDGVYYARFSALWQGQCTRGVRFFCCPW